MLILRDFLLSSPAQIRNNMDLQATKTQAELDEMFMRMALQEARAAAADGEVPVGAVIVCKGRVLARTHNLTERLIDVTAHAEIQAITAAASALGGKYLPDCTLYVTVEPCPMCAGALGWAQIGRIVYGADDPKRGYSRLALSTHSLPTSPILHPRTQVVSGVLAEECAALIRDFFKERRPTP